MSQTTLKILQSDANDPRYHSIAKTLLGIPLFMYSVGFLLLHHTLNIIKNDQNETTLIIAEAKDGLQMSVKHDLPEWKLILHSFCAMGLLFICIFQKENIKWMSRSANQYIKWINIHRWVGRFSLVLILGMDIGGLLMGTESTLEKFQIFVIFFAAPFFCFGLGLYLTAKPSLLEYHRIFANMLVKGCIGTPLARLGGSLFQRIGYFNLSSGYYCGIGFVTLILGSWQVVELIEFWINGQSSKVGVVVRDNISINDGVVVVEEEKKIQ
jgi:hypothetical protein